MSDPILTHDERATLDARLLAVQMQVRAGPHLDPGTVEECMDDGMSEAEAEEYIARFPEQAYRAHEHAQLVASALGKALACVDMWDRLTADLEAEDGDDDE